MRIWHLCSPAALFLAIIATTNLFAAGEGAMKVRVLTPDRKPLDKQIRATVRISSASEINDGLVARTDENGAAYFYKLAPGIYTIRVDVDGYQSSLLRTDVKTDQVSHVTVTLKTSSPLSVTVQDAFDMLDTTSVTTGLSVNQDLMGTLPGSKRIADQALFVPGVYLNPTTARQHSSNLAGSGDPSLLVTVNRDKFGQNGFSTNNYMLDGIDTSNPLDGRGTVNIMTDLIADIDIKTGGVSAEYQAKNGIFFNASTINGGNEFHGGFTGDYTPSALRANSKAGRPSIEEQSQSLGFFAFGPIIKSKLWFVVAAQKTLDHGKIALGDGVASVPGETRPFTGNSEESLFTKLTWQISSAHRFIGEFHSNRNWNNNGDDSSTVTNWLQRTDAGGDRFLLWYSFQQPWLMADVKFGHDFQRNRRSDYFAAMDSTQIFSVDALSPVQSQFGTYGIRDNQFTDRNDGRVDFLIPLATGPITHTLKLGYQDQHSRFVADYVYSVPNNQNIDQVMTFNDVVNNGLTYLPNFVDGVLNALNTNPAYASIKASLAPGGGDVAYGDLAGYEFGEQDPTHPGTYYTFRASSLLKSNPSSIRSQMKGFYVQDYMTLGNLTFSPGFRVDTYTIKDDRGVTVFAPKSLFAPRIGITWDVMGEAKSKIYAYFGRYFNPVFGSTVRDTGMTKSTGMVFETRIMGEWVNSFEAPTEGTAESVFANGTEMPYTDEFRVGYEQIVKTRNAVHTFSLAGTYRQDKKIIQGMDPFTYTDADGLEAFARSYWGITNAPDALTPQEARLINSVRGLALPLASFAGGGYTGQENLDHSAQVYLNAPNARRTFKSADLSYKFETSKALLFASYSWLDARGTSMEVGDMTPNGYFPLADSRMPWMNGKQDGSLDWMFKVYGSCKFGYDIILGVFGRMDSGYHYTASKGGGGGAILPDVPWELSKVDSFQVGSKMTPKRVQFDLHVEKRFKVGHGTELWLSANVFNCFNNQNGVALAEGTNIRSGVAVDRPYLFQAPRSVSLSAKLRY